MVDDSAQEMKKNLRLTWDFCRKHYVIFLLLILVAVNLYLRLTPFFLPATDDWARASMDSYLTQSVRSDVEKHYPTMPQEIIDKMVAEEKQKVYREKAAEIGQQVQLTSKQFKDFFSNEDGITYLLELDPYMWYKFAKNIEDHGYPGDYIAQKDIYSYDLIKKGAQVDSFSLAPFGKGVGTITFYPYFIYAWSMVLKPFGFDMYGAEFLIPAFWVTLAIFPLFFIVRRIAGNMGGFVASMIMITNIPFLGRAIAGFADTDCFQVVIPLFIAWFLIEAYYAKKVHYKIILACLSALSMVWFAVTWIGWAYIYCAVGGFMVIYAVILLLTKQSLKEHIILSAVFMVVSMPLLTLARGIYSVLMILWGPLTLYKMQSVAIEKIWPNVYTTVAEQNASSLTTVINALGNKWFYLFMGLAIVLMVIKKEWKHITLFSLWFLGTAYVTTYGTRYVQLNLPAFAVLAGIGAGFAFNYLVKQTGKIMRPLFANGVWIIVAVFFLFFLIPPAHAVAKSEIPMMNDMWWEGLSKIDREASPDAIINSWWDMGHWFKAVGNRPVTFDGASQDTPPAHWIGRALLTSDEHETIAILRMLDCGGNRAYNIINEEIKDDYKSVVITKKALLMDKGRAKEYLMTIISNETAGKVMPLMFCDNPPEDYFITSEDMIGKSGVWAHFGSWDFEKAKMYQDYTLGKDASYFMGYYNLTQLEANNLIYKMSSMVPGEVNSWIAPWPSYAGSFGQCRTEGSIISCANQMSDTSLQLDFNTTSKDAVFAGSDSVRPASVVLLEDGRLKEYKYSGNKTYPLSMSILPNGYNMLSTPEIGMSMFNRLLNYEGIGLEHFESFYSGKDITNARLYIWKVKW